MSTIKDIRVYRSHVENIPGNSLPEGFKNKQLHCTIHRIVMKLRENDFSLGEFDHLYINLTTCPVADGFSLSKRGKDIYEPWYRYYDVEISEELYNSLEIPDSVQPVIDIVEHTLVLFFTDVHQNRELVHSCVFDAVTMGENMEMLFKRKVSSKRKAFIYLRYLDSGCYFPLLRIYDDENRLMFETDLPKTIELNAFGEIQLNNKSITIKPRKNVFAEHLQPMIFTF